MASYHENIQMCLFYILSNQEEKEFAQKQNELFLNVVHHFEKHHEDSTSEKIDFYFLLDKILSDRNYYMRYIFSNKTHFEVLAHALNSRLFQKASQPQRSSKKLIRFYSSNYTPSDELLNHKTLNLLIKLTQNLIIDINFIKDALLKKTANKSTKEANKSLPQKNQDMSDMLTEKYPSPRVREITLKSEDMESEEAEEDQLKPDIGKGNYPIQLKSYVYSSILKPFNFVIQNFSEVSFQKKSKFGFINLHKLEFISLTLELLINTNFLIKKWKNTEESVEVITILNSALSDGFEEEMNGILLFDSFKSIKFFENLAFCLAKFDLHTMMLAEIENIVYLISSRYCPAGLGESLISSNLIEKLLQISQSNDQPEHLPHLCELATTIFMSTNQEVQHSVETGKLIILTGRRAFL